MTRTETIKKQKKENKANIFRKIRKFIFTVIISVIILMGLGIVIIFHSPYTQLKDLFVTTAMTTMSHQYLARLFVSEEEIQKIMTKYKIDDLNENTDKSEIKPDTNIISSGDGIQLENISGTAFKGYMLIIKDPSRVAVGTTTDIGKHGMRVEDIAKKYGAVAGINAGGFADAEGHGTGGTPLGLLIENYKVLHADSSRKHAIIGFDRNNVLVLGNYTAKQIKDMGIRDAVSFRPFLIINGKSTIKSGDGGWGIAPRTAIGQRVDGTVLFLVIDGRQIESIGATLKDVQDIMLQYGAHNAANLDGGSSSTLVYNDNTVNSPSSKYGARYVPSAFIVKQ